MSNKAVSLLRQVKTEDGKWKRYPVAYTANGRVKPNTVIVAGKEKTYPVGRYILRSFEGSKLRWTPVEGGATEALAALKTAKARANATVVAEQAGVQVVVDPQRTLLRDAADKFVQAAIDRGTRAAGGIYKHVIAGFLDSCRRKLYADELTNEDVGRWLAALRKRGLSNRTLFNSHKSLKSFLRSLGLDVKAIAGKSPKYDKTLPEIYEKEELASFFASLTSEYDRLLFRLLLSTGLREAEASNLEWKDISFARRTLQVVSKSERNHYVKDSEEREVALTDDLIERLQAYRETHKKFCLVFGKRGGEIDAVEPHMLRRLRMLVKKAGLECGSCAQCLAGTGYERWFVHKFRATYVTKLLRGGIDLRTTMRLSGHSDLASVMRYLRPAGTDEIQVAVNAIAWE